MIYKFTIKNPELEFTEIDGHKLVAWHAIFIESDKDLVKKYAKNEDIYVKPQEDKLPVNDKYGNKIVVHKG